MYKKLDESTINNLLESGIQEFAANGFDKANINQIAKRAGLSVGVIYKYYEDKDGFFIACVRHALRVLDQILKDVYSESTDLSGNIRNLLTALIENAKSYKEYHLMYHEITAGGCTKFAVQLANEIEAFTAGLYSNIIEKARQEGIIRQDIDSRLFAFFFDNLLMMLHFSYSCDYYIERMKIYCGGEKPDDEVIINEMMKLLNAAFGIA
ncbi:MAG: TetR/AcrR family transcriptional regulator [Parasporobacterium sp.]|nr:TetR/AcrR family transcriptional regulator [Parasporobacterium sp.]